jgi:hypothetical protein
MKGGNSVERTAVIYDAHPLWLEAVEGVLERLNVKVRGKTTRLSVSFVRISRMFSCWSPMTESIRRAGSP